MDTTTAPAAAPAAPAASAASEPIAPTSATVVTSGQQQADPYSQNSTPQKPEWLPEKFWRNDAPDVESLAKSYQGVEQLLGKKSQAVLPPNEKSTPEEIAAFRKALGVPESPEGYGIAKPQDLPEGVTWDDNVAKSVAEVAHKHNIPAAAMQELVKLDLMRAAQQNEAAAQMIHQQLDAGRQELQRVYGENLQAKIDLAKRAAATVGVDPSSQGFLDPNVVKGFIALAEKLSDDKLVEGGAISNSSGQARAKDIQTNPSNPLYNRYREGDPEIVDQVRRMISQG
jgi:hypothetical protein